MTAADYWSPESSKNMQAIIVDEVTANNGILKVCQHFNFRHQMRKFGARQEGVVCWVDKKKERDSTTKIGTRSDVLLR